MRRIGHRYRDLESGTTIDTWFPPNNEKLNRGCLAEKLGLIEADWVELDSGNLELPAVSTEEVYLRLHLLSECAVRPNSMNLDGIFALLPNIAWTSAGPVLPERVAFLKNILANKFHQLTISHVDKFPRMIDYVVPKDVRIGDADRVRLGAHLAPGTTVMHEGFVNFNAGTIGPAMVEGRITPGVIVGKDSDVGAGSSIMGTLSGGGKQVNSIGERSLLGANGGIGISLGDECIVEAGLYVTAGTKVKLESGEVVQARQLSGRSNLLYRRNSQTGQVEAVTTDSSRWGGLNKNLHATKTD